MIEVDKVNVFEQIIGYEFKDKKLLQTALTHSSYANEMNGKVMYNERLEFLGDSVLGMITAEFFYTNHPEMPEGKLTKIRAAMVCEKSLYRFAQSIKLGEFMYMGKGEINTGGRNRPSILADAFESLIAAIYLDSNNLAIAQEFIKNNFKKHIDTKSEPHKDYKTTLQEKSYQLGFNVPQYTLLEKKGSEHEPIFLIKADIGKGKYSTGVGKNKKQAEQQAAKRLLEMLGEKND